MNELTLHLDKKADTPLFMQLYHFIKQEIISGNYIKNEKMPSKRQLAAALQCSQNTVQAAYHQLVAEGYLISRVKSGYYVAELDGIVTIAKMEKKKSIPLKDTIRYQYIFSHQGVDYHSFPFSTWWKITKDVINEYDLDLVKVGDSKGYSSLRESIARYLHQSRGVNCSPEQIIISSGTEFLLQLLIQMFDEKFIYAIENPGYEKLGMIFQSNRVLFQSIDLDNHGIKPDKLRKSLANVVCITPSHQFPTGSIMPINRRIQLLNWANEKKHRYIIEDDYDSEFRYSGKPIPSLQGLDQNGRVIYMGAFSKSLSPALRISYMVLPEHLLEAYHNKLSFYICPVPTMEQKTLQRFIDEGFFERHLNRMRNIYKQKRETIVNTITELLPGAQIQGASAGLHLTLRVHNGMNEQELIKAAREQQVKVYGLSKYYSITSSNNQNDTLLLGFATLKNKDIVNAVSLLKKAWY